GRAGYVSGASLLVHGGGERPAFLDAATVNKERPRRGPRPGPRRAPRAPWRRWRAGARHPPGPGRPPDPGRSPPGRRTGPAR
ncbi:hypothetical protein ACWDA9_40105, partial [Streptomyces sp. NPDC001193]